LAFSDSQCGACNDLPALLGRMRSVRSDQVTITLVVRVHGADRSGLEGLEGESLLLDDDELLSAYGILRLPSLVVVDETGRVASSTVAGLEAIEELLATARGAPALEVLTRP